MTNKGITIIGIFLVAIFLIFVFSKTPTTKPKGEANATANISSVAKDLYLESLVANKGLDTYTYSYYEDLNGYLTKITLLKGKAKSKVSWEIPLSKRSVYFLENSTILCIAIKNQSEKCAYAENTTNVNDFVGKMNGFFFDDLKMLDEVENMAFLIENGFLTFEGIDEKNHTLGVCKNIKFKINYDLTKLTVDEAARLGLGAGSPTSFDSSFCVDGKNKQIYEKHFEYIYGGRPVYTDFNLLSYSLEKEPEIELPLNVSNKLASTIIVEEEEAVSEFLRCYKKIDEKERETCIYSYAIYNMGVDACIYAGSKKDLCFLNVAVVKKDANVCPSIASADYKDDCYIEVAGLMKDQSLCSLVADQTKAAKCNEVATSEKEVTMPSTRYVDSNTIEIANYNETKEREETEKLVEKLISED